MTKIICCFLFLLSAVEASVWEAKNSWDESLRENTQNGLKQKSLPDFLPQVDGEV